MLGAVAGGVPLPWVPDVLQKRVRGALVQDIAARHGLSVSPEARALLADPGRTENGETGVMAHAVRFFTRKLLVRFGPLGMLPPVRACVGTFVLGHLLGRYLETRDDRSLRIDAVEARAIRQVIDRTLLNLLSVELVAEGEAFDAPTEDLRDDVTQIVDGVLIATAGLPSWLVRRLDASFDDMLAGPHG
jgi:plasmid stability protein